MRALAVLAVLAVLTTAWFGWSWLSASNDENLAFAHTRDSVLAVGQQQVAALNTLDYRTAEGGLARWQQIATGNLLDELNRNHDSDLRNIQQVKTVTTAKVLGAAVSRLDVRAGTADVLVAVEVTVTPDGGKASVQRSRLDAVLTKVGDDWKVSTLQAIGVAA